MKPIPKSPLNTITHKQTRLLITLLTLSVLCSSFLCPSMSPAQAQTDYSRWHVFTMADGLADNFVLDIYQDRDGNLWLGTQRGVSYYNGDWETFTVSDGLGANEVWSIVEDNEGALWFATWGGGVTRYDGKEWQVFDDTDGLISREVRTVTKDRNGSLWFGTRLGVSRYKEGRWESFTTEDGLVDNDVRAIAQDNEGVFWFGTSEGVSTFDGIKWQTFTSSDGLIGNDVWTIFLAQDGALWFGTTIGVSRYDGDWETFAYIGLRYSFVYSIAQDTDGSLWFGGFGGVTQHNVENRNWEAFTPSDRLFSETVRSVFIDRDGYLWVGTQGNGVGCYDKVTWTTFTEKDGLAGNEVTSAFLDQEGGLWFGTETGVSLYEDGLWKQFSVADGLVNNFVVAITQDREGAMWFGTGGGVSRFDGENWVSYTTADGLATNAVRSILQDQEGNFWFGTFGATALDGKGVSRFDGKDWQTLTTEDGLANNNVRYILQDNDRNLWFGTFGGGVSRFDGLEWEAVNVDVLAGTDIRWILQTQDGSLWFAVWRKGAIHFDGDAWEVFGRDNSGLPNNDVISIFQDRDGILWFSTAFGGVTRYDGQEWYTFTSATSGLAGNVVKPIIQDQDGNLWFGTWTLNAGVSRYSPSRTLPWVDIIRFNDIPYDGNEVSIPLSAGLVTIELLGGDLYTDASDLVYFYKLEGVDNEWKRTTSRFITYPIPNPGKHVFEVKVRDGHFNYSDPPTEVELVIAPPPPTLEPKRIVISATPLPTPLPEIREVPVEPRYTIAGVGAFTLSQLLGSGVGLGVLLGLGGLGVVSWRRQQAKGRPRPLPKEYFNPYVVGKPVTGRNFVGRQDIFADLITALKGDNHLIIEGERRIGKTSLLYELAEALRQDGDYCFIPAYVQLQRVTKEKLFYAIMREIARESRRRCEQLPPLRCEAPYDDYDTFDAEDDLLAIIKALKENTDLPLRIVILLDEGDRLRDFTEETHSHLRGWMGADIQKDVLILVWCGVSFDKAWHQRTSPWYNQFRSAIEIPPLSPQEARTLITRPAEGSYEYEGEAIERILTLSQRKPFVIQLVCHECVRRIWQEQSGAIITLEDVGAVWPLVQRRLESDEQAETPSEDSTLSSLTYPTAVPAQQIAEEAASYNTKPEGTSDDA